MQPEGTGRAIEPLRAQLCRRTLQPQATQPAMIAGQRHGLRLQLQPDMLHIQQGDVQGHCLGAPAAALQVPQFQACRFDGMSRQDAKCQHAASEQCNRADPAAGLHHSVGKHSGRKVTVTAVADDRDDHRIFNLC